MHHAYRFEGPAGVGKEMTAFALAQALVCATTAPAGQVFAACGSCSACTRATSFTEEAPRVPRHPDVVVIERGLYPAEVLRRTRAETQEISVDQIPPIGLWNGRASAAPRQVPGVHRPASRRAVDIGRQCAAEDARRAKQFDLLHPHQRSRQRALDDGTFKNAARAFRPALRKAGPSISESAAFPRRRRRWPPRFREEARKRPSSSAIPRRSKSAKPSSTRRSPPCARPISASAITLSEARARDKEVLYDRLAALAGRFARLGRKIAHDDARRASVAARHYMTVTRAMRELERNGSPALVLEAMVARSELAGFSAAG